MKTLALLAVVSLTFGCAGVRLYSPTTGKKLADVTANGTNVTVQGGDMYFHADTLDSSTPTTAAWNGVTKETATIASGAVAFIAPVGTASPAVQAVSKAAIVTAPHVAGATKAPATPAPAATPKPVAK